MRNPAAAALVDMVKQLSNLTAEHDRTFKADYAQIQPDAVTVGMLLKEQDALIAKIVASVTSAVAIVLREEADDALLRSLDFTPGDETSDGS